MADNSQKTPLARKLNQFAERKAISVIQLLGKALPCSVAEVNGAIIKIQFQVQSVFVLPPVWVPLFGPIYIRYPIQVGDTGVAFPADARLGGVTGMGGGLADLSLPANLSALVFFPLGNATWPTENPDVIIVQGPGGTQIRDINNTCSVTVTPTGVRIIGNVIIDGTVTSTGIMQAPDVISDSVSGASHVHSGVSPGTGVSGKPVP